MSLNNDNPKSQSALTAEKRETLTSDPSRQNEAHVLGAYDYLNSGPLLARYGILGGLIEQRGCDSVLDIGCTIGTLRASLNPSRGYDGIDIAGSVIALAKRTFSDWPRTRFLCGDIRSSKELRPSYPCVVWAGVGYGYSNQEHTFLDLFARSGELCEPGGLLLVECIDEYGWIARECEKVGTIINHLHIEHRLAAVHNTRHVFAVEKPVYRKREADE